MLPGHTIPGRLGQNASRIRRRPVATSGVGRLSRSDGMANACRSSSLPSFKKAGIDNPDVMANHKTLLCLSTKATGQKSAVTKASHGDSLDWSVEKRNAILARQTDWINKYFGLNNDVHQSWASGSDKTALMSTFPPPSRRQKSNSTAPRHSLRMLHKVARSDEKHVWDLALELNLPWERMKAAYTLFKKHVDNNGKDVRLVQHERLTRKQFAKLICAMTECNCEAELPQGIVEDAFMSAGKDCRDELSFNEFAIWFSTHSFSEKLNLDANQRALRKLARKYFIPHTQVDQYKQLFDEFDADCSGMIKAAEFPNVLCKCAKIPENGLSSARLQQLWRDADADGSGEVDFEEFLVFYRKYFDVQAPEGAGFENFYRSVRNHPWTC